MRWASVAAVGILLLSGCTTPGSSDGPGFTSDAPDGGPAPTAEVAAQDFTHDLIVDLMQDVAGDATEFTSEAAVENADRQADWACLTLEGNVPPARDQCDALPSDGGRPHVGGVPAPPGLDLTGVQWIETAQGVTVRFLVAGWDGQWTSIVPRPGSSAAYGLSWENETCAGTFALSVVDLPGGVESRTMYTGVGPGCRHVVGGSFNATAGSPASFELSFPWADLPWRGRLNLSNAVAVVVRDELAAGPGGYFSVRGAALNTPQDNLDYSGYVVDATNVAPFSIVRGPPGSLPPPEARPRLDDVQITTTGADPDLDILAIELLDTPTRVTLRVELSRVEATPDSLSFQMQFDGRPNDAGVPSIYIFDAQTSSGQWEMNANRLAQPDLHVESLPTEAKVTPGSPGFLEWTMDRFDLEVFAGGEIMHRLAATMASPSVRRAETLGAGESMYANAYAQGHDFIIGHVRFTTGLPLGAAASAVTAQDGQGDAEVPAEARALFSDAQADIQAAEFRVLDSTLGRARLSLFALGNLYPPPGYTAVFYGIAIQQPDGRTTTVGYYASVTDNEPRYFCGGDRTILADRPEDPLAGGDVDFITGILKEGSAGTGGYIEFVVPTSCFGFLDEDRLVQIEVSRMRAGTYLLGQAADVDAGGRIHAMDLADAEDPRILTFRSPAQFEPSFWAKPFGIENFWDIAAIVATGIGAAVGGILVLFRRSRLNHYLRRIEGARRQDLTAREATLSDVARDLERDLLRHRIPTDHYAVVESRLDPLLARTRASILAAEVPGLPESLLTRAEALMADGELSAQDTARLLQAAKGLDAKRAEALRLRLAAWTT